MAYATKYRVFFSDIDGYEYRADLKYDGYSGSITELQGSGDAVTIEYENSDNKFNVINGSGCTLKFYNNGTLDAEDLFAVGLYDIQMIIERYSKEVTGGDWDVIFGGYVNPEVFTEDYSWAEGLLSITANDSFNALKREKYFSGSDIDDDGTVIKAWDLGTTKITNVISNCLLNSPITRIHTMIDTYGSVSDFFSLEVDLSNYVDEDEESMTKRDVLESILEPLTLRAYIFGGTCWIVDPTLFATSTVGVDYEAYDTSFVAISGGDDTYNKDFDISNSDVEFRDGNQSMDLVGGFQSMISNYSAYPYEKKIIPFEFDDIEIPSFATWQFFNYTDDREGGYGYRQLHTYDYSNYGLTFDITASSMSEYAENSNSNADWLTMQAQLMSGVLGGDKCFLLKNSIYNESDPDTSSIVITIDTAKLPKTTDSFTFTCKILVNFLYATPSDIPIERISLSSYVYSPISGVISEDDVMIGNGTGLKGEWTEMSCTVDGVDYSSNLEIRIKNKVYLVKTNGSVIDIGGQADIFLKDFEVVSVNGLSINEDDLEYKTESGTEFISDHTIEINNSSRRENGVLDRGAFWNTDGEHETYFNRTSFPQSGSIGLTMAKAYMNNYVTPYRKLNATLFTEEDMIKEENSGGFFKYNISNVFTPLSIIQDTDYLGTKRFIFSGGTVDLINKTISGTWDELFDADYTITELT